MQLIDHRPIATHAEDETFVVYGKQISERGSSCLSLDTQRGRHHADKWTCGMEAGG